jgi:hypothetical protein
VLDTIAAYELAEDRIDPVAYSAEADILSGMQIVQLVPMRRKKLKAARPVPLWHLRISSYGLRFQNPTTLRSGLVHRELRNAGGSNADAGDDAWPADFHVCPEAVGGLPYQRVLAESSHASEAAILVGVSEEGTLTRSHRWRNSDRDSQI